jgi:hypothetical protein
MSVEPSDLSRLGRRPRVDRSALALYLSTSNLSREGSLDPDDGRRKTDRERSSHDPKGDYPRAPLNFMSAAI